MNILSSNYWVRTKAYNTINFKSQADYYKSNNSNETILRLVSLDSKRFGSAIESIICELFKLEKRTSPQHDAILKTNDKSTKIEIKSARYWSDGDDCKWQHIELEYDYDVVLFVLLDFNGFVIYGIKKSILVGKLKEIGVLKKQGIQGWWIKKSDATKHCVEIKTTKDLRLLCQ
jgi:hypothetical protein